MRAPRTRQGLARLVVAASALTAALGGGAASGVGAGAPAPAAYGETVRPVLDQRGAADPTVVRAGDTWVALSTGRFVPRATAPSAAGPWTDAGNALTTLPSWAAGDRIWASDLIHTDAGWVLYFAAPVAGLGVDGRCIGVATAASPLDQFTPSERPLVCPRRAATPPAYDDVRPGIQGLPKKTGVIDPEGWTDKLGRRYVLYRTQSRPSSIRMVRVPRDGIGSSGQRDSIELLRRGGVLENPVLVQRADRYILLTSRRSFVDCRYATTWRKSRTLEGLSHAPQHILLDAATTGLCGPGGADLAGGDADTGADDLLFLHSWSCRDLRYHCPAGTDYDATGALGSHRAMFAATLAWSDHGVPRLTGWLTPPVDPWAPPTPTPAPVAAPSPVTHPTPGPGPGVS